MIKLSDTSKTPGKSWSLQAIDTCPGSKQANGQLVPACRTCYATTGNYRFKNVKAAREHNRQDWQRDGWVEDMVKALDNERWFRWFDSGDMYHIDLARKILEVCERTPWVNHWLPTRMYKFDKFKYVLLELEDLENVCVRYSSDSITGQTIPGWTTSTIIPSLEYETGAFVCKASTRGGKCGDCRACWDNSVSVVAYVGHGQKYKKHIKLVEV